jgi:hypothetical protein
MPQMNSIRRKLALAATASLVVALPLGLAACGGSSSTTTSTNASATTPSGDSGAGSTSTTGSGPAGAGASRFKALRECLQKNGITLPQRTPGQYRHRPGGPGGFLGGGAAGGGPKLPSGVTRAQYEAAIKKCGGGAFAGGAAARLKNPTYLAALTKFAACMRENGVNVPAPNTSGSGPIFDTKGIDTSSSQFRTAETKCRTDLTSAFHRPGGTTPSGTPSGGAPAG